MTCHHKTEDERARRFRDVVIPCLDDAYTLAFFLMRNRTDAEDAVQECYLRALRHFDNWRGSAIKPWLLAILRNVCYSEFARRGRQEAPANLAGCERPAEQCFWREPQALPDTELLNRQEGAAILQIVGSLPAKLREVIVLREFRDMPYHQIAEVAGVPMGTVMSRLSRARALLLAGWKARDSAAPQQSGPNSLAPTQGLSRILADGH